MHNQYRSLSNYRLIYSLTARLLSLVVICAAASSTAFGMPVRPDELSLQRALLAGHYSAVERELSELQRGYLTGKHSDWSVDYAFRSFATTNQVVGKKLSLWVNFHPNSAIVNAANGVYQENLGWIMRGTQSAQNTSDVQFTNMQRHFKLAYRYLERATQLDPSLSVSYVHLIRMFKAFAPRKAQQQLLHDALKHCKNSFAIRYEYLYSLQPRWGGSIEEIRQFVANDANDHMDKASLATLRGFADYAIAQDLILRGNYDSAVKHYDKALSGDKFALYYIARGNALRWLRRYGQAERDYNSALASEPNYSQALEDKANNDIAWGHFAAARSDVDQALRVDPLNPDLLSINVTLYSENGKTRKILTALERMLVYDPEDAGVYRDIGTAENVLNNRPAASRAFRKAVMYAPNNAGYWLQFAQVLYESSPCKARDPLSHFQTLCKTTNEAACSPYYRHWAAYALKALRHNASCTETVNPAANTRAVVR